MTKQRFITLAFTASFLWSAPTTAGGLGIGVTTDVVSELFPSDFDGPTGIYPGIGPMVHVAFDEPREGAFLEFGIVAHWRPDDRRFSPKYMVRATGLWGYRLKLGAHNVRAQLGFAHRYLPEGVVGISQNALSPVAGLGLGINLGSSEIVLSVRTEWNAPTLNVALVFW